MPTFRSLNHSILAVTLTVSLCQAQNADWPQWRGPNRDGHAAVQSLLQQWPDDGPALKWAFRDTGVGYSAFSVADGQLFTMGVADEVCSVICIDAAKGTEVWRTKISAVAKDSDYLHAWGGGPRSTPTTDNGRVYALSDTGALACLESSSGKTLWNVHLVDDLGGSIPKWGYSDSPLIDGNRVVITPGGSKFMVALDKHSGKEVWRSKGVSAEAQYVSIMKHTIDGITFYVSASKPGLFAFDATSGEKVFADTATGNTVAVVPTTITRGNNVYHTSAYGAGNTLLRLTASGTALDVDPIYSLSKASKSMENHHGGVVLVDGVVYGFTKANRGNWMAQDFVSGETLWMESVGKTRSGSIAYADGRLYCYNDQDGSVYLVKPSRDGFQTQGKLVVPEQTSIDRGKGAIWAHPVIADQTLFLRDQDLLFAFDIAR